MLDAIPDILEDLRDGKVIILVDDEDRENEGDFVCAAEKMTPEIVNFLMRVGAGYLCVAMRPGLRSSGPDRSSQAQHQRLGDALHGFCGRSSSPWCRDCLLYTSDAADDL